MHTQGSSDWTQIAALYGELGRATGSPVVEVNRAVAIAEAGEPERALAIVDEIDLAEYRYVHSTRAEILWRLGRLEEADAAYQQALEMVHDESERRLFAQLLDELRRSADRPQA